MSVKFVAYYRVSTKEQGESGLGLEAQKSAIVKYVDSVNGQIISEYTDVETGKNDNRENLWMAVADAKTSGAVLIVKNFDRMSRGGLEVMARLEKFKISFIECDSPHDNTLLKELKFSIARDEVRKTSERTSSALQVIKSKLENGIEHISKKGNKVTHLGNPDNLSDAARKKGRDKRKENAINNENNKRAYAFIKLMKESEGYSASKASKRLNESGFLTTSGGKFTTTQVIRLVKLYENET